MDRDRYLGSPEWVRWAAGLPGRPLFLTNLSAGASLATGRMIIKGYSLRNTATTAGQCDLIDGSNNNGNVFNTADIAGSSSATGTFGAAGLLLEQGIYVNPVVSTFTGAVWIVPLWEYEFTQASD
jgi:hypothetical protein